MFLFVFVRLEFFPLPFILVDFLRSCTSLSLFFFRSLHLLKMHLSVHIFIFVVGAVVVLSIYLSFRWVFALLWFCMQFFFITLYILANALCVFRVQSEFALRSLYLSLFHSYFYLCSMNTFCQPVQATIILHYVHCYYRYYWFAVFIIICCYLLWPMNKNGFRNIVCFCTRYFLFYLIIYFFLDI